MAVKKKLSRSRSNLASLGRSGKLSSMRGPMFVGGPLAKRSLGIATEILAPTKGERLMGELSGGFKRGG